MRIDIVHNSKTLQTTFPGLNSFKITYLHEIIPINLYPKNENSVIVYCMYVCILIT